MSKQGKKVETRVVCKILFQSEKVLSEHRDIRNFFDMRADQPVQGERVAHSNLAEAAYHTRIAKLHTSIFTHVSLSFPSACLRTQILILYPFTVLSLRVLREFDRDCCDSIPHGSRNNSLEKAKHMVAEPGWRTDQSHARLLEVKYVKPLKSSQ